MLRSLLFAFGYSLFLGSYVFLAGTYRLRLSKIVVFGQTAHSKKQVA